MIHSSLRTILLVAEKELRSSVRDRQTVIYSVVLPLVMYPAIFWVMLQGFSYIENRDRVTEVHVAIGGTPEGVDPARVEAGLERTGAIAEGEEAPPPNLRVTRLTAALDEAGAERLLRDEEERDRRDDPPDAVLLFTDDAARPAVLVFDGTRSRSSLAAERVRARMETLADVVRDDAVRDHGEDPERLSPFTLRERNLASDRDVGGYILSFVLPLTFIVMAVLGAFYPAVDLTAGEKERRTAETTMLLPTPRYAVLLGKVLSVFVATVVATSLNLVGMALAAEHLLAGMSRKGGFAIEIPWSSFLIIAPLCAIFLFAMSAFMVAVSSLADTFKQGQSLLGIVQQLFIIPAVLAILPGVKLTLGLALVPVVQTVLAFKEVLQTDGDGGAGTMVFVVVGVSQLAYAALALFIAVRLTSRESLFAGGASLRRLVSLLRSKGAPR